MLSPAGSSSAAAQARSASAAALQSVDSPTQPSPRSRELKGKKNEGGNGRGKASKRVSCGAHVKANRSWLGYCLYRNTFVPPQVVCGSLPCFFY